MKNRVDPAATVEDVAFADVAALAEPVAVARPAASFTPESRFVRVVGYAAAFGRADGEPCNCNKGASPGSGPEAYVDLHVRLVPTAADVTLWKSEPWLAITAEATPRLMSASCRDALLGGSTVAEADGLATLQRRGIAGATGQVRLTGYLFADDDKGEDSAHDREDGGGKRLTVWEVHPLFRIETCSTQTPCEATTDRGWVSLWSAGSGAAGLDRCDGT